MGLYTLDRYPIAGNGRNGFAFGLGLIKAEQIVVSWYTGLYVALTHQKSV
jgi:hypothetical protein